MAGLGSYRSMKHSSNDRSFISRVHTVLLSPGNLPLVKSIPKQFLFHPHKSISKSKKGLFYACFSTFYK